MDEARSKVLKTALSQISEDKKDDLKKAVKAASGIDAKKQVLGDYGIELSDEELDSVAGGCSDSPGSSNMEDDTDTWA